MQSAYPAATAHTFCSEPEPDEFQAITPAKDYCAIAMEQGHACPPSSPDEICLSLTQELTDGSRSSAILAKITHSEAVQLSGIQIDGSAWVASSRGVAEGEPTIPYTEQIRLNVVASAGCTEQALASVTPFSITVA